jgi:hypothetical protein
MLRTPDDTADRKQADDGIHAFVVEPDGASSKLKLVLQQPPDYEPVRSELVLVDKLQADQKRNRKPSTTTRLHPNNNPAG